MHFQSIPLGRQVTKSLQRAAPTIINNIGEEALQHWSHHRTALRNRRSLLSGWEQYQP